MLRVGENIVVQYLPVWNKQPNRAASLSRKYEESAHKNNTLKDKWIQPWFNRSGDELMLVSPQYPTYLEDLIMIE